MGCGKLIIKKKRDSQVMAEIDILSSKGIQELMETETDPGNTVFIKAACKQGHTWSIS